MTVNEHIKKSFKRLTEEEYSSEKVWQPKDYEWPGDWEGRALLAIVSLNSISDEENGYAHKIVAELKNHVNREGFLGPEFNQSEIREQQLSGHTWLTRGLIEYYKLYGDKTALDYAKKIVYNLYLPITDYVAGYPVKRAITDEGAVSGNNNLVLNGWRLSTDVGCVFVGLDGLTAYYAETKDEKVKELIDRLVDKFVEFDKVAARAQTHATLTASRSILRMYTVTKDEKYLKIAENEYENYLDKGMTETYENFNWFGREDTWTEPCAIVDSIILTLSLADVTGDKKYEKMARRIWFNGLSFCHRANGGAGTNTCVTENQPVLRASMFEAYFCCTMRYCEGLVFIKRHEDLFKFNGDAETVKENGKYFKDDVLILKRKKDGEKILITDIEVSKENAEEEYYVFY